MQLFFLKSLFSQLCEDVNIEIIQRTTTGGEKPNAENLKYPNRNVCCIYINSTDMLIQMFFDLLVPICSSYKTIRQY